jgi:hypothetical protein
MNMQISVSPNPFTHLVRIAIQGESKIDNHCVIRFIDQKGKILRMLGISLEPGSNQIDIDKLEDLPAGAYYLDIKNSEGDDIYSARLVKE